ncbi:zf-RVT domain-containing protein, partial [Cephalotus follicularis]
LPPLSRGRDKLLWAKNSSGLFSTKSAWNSIRTEGISCPWFHLVWSFPIVPRHSFILWVVIRGRHRVKQIPKTRGVINDDTCPLCLAEIETTEHLLSTCDFYPEILDRQGSREILKLLIPGFIYHIWQQRNARIFGSVGETQMTLLSL